MDAEEQADLERRIITAMNRALEAAHKGDEKDFYAWCKVAGGDAWELNHGACVFTVNDMLSDIRELVLIPRMKMASGAAP